MVSRAAAPPPTRRSTPGILIFALVGPPVGLVTGMLFVIPLVSLIAGGGWDLQDQHLISLIVLLPVAYMLGIVPAALVGCADAFIARKRIPGRIFWTTLIGFFASFLPVLGALIAGFMHGPFILIGGIVGALPAALCSWLAGRRRG